MPEVNYSVSKRFLTRGEKGRSVKHQWSTEKKLQEHCFLPQIATQNQERRLAAKHMEPGSKNQ